MLNQVHIEGFVTRKIWQYGGDTFFRLAVYRDPDRPRKEADRGENGRDRPDYVTIRVPAALTALPVEFRPGQRIQVHGWLESRQYSQTLAEFLGDCGVTGVQVAGADPDEVSANRGSTWVVAERIVEIPEKSKNSK